MSPTTDAVKTYYDPISTLGEAGQKWWSDQT